MMAVYKYSGLSWRVIRQVVIAKFLFDEMTWRREGQLLWRRLQGWRKSSKDQDLKVIQLCNQVNPQEWQQRLFKDGQTNDLFFFLFFFFLFLFLTWLSPHDGRYYRSHTATWCCLMHLPDLLLNLSLPVTCLSLFLPSSFTFPLSSSTIFTPSHFPCLQSSGKNFSWGLICGARARNDRCSISP